ncbi:MAG: hypothetical protein ACRC8Y_15055 [Chroococcales cyanobacterium]
MAGSSGVGDDGFGKTTIPQQRKEAIAFTIPLDAPQIYDSL